MQIGERICQADATLLTEARQNLRALALFTRENAAGSISDMRILEAQENCGVIYVPLNYRLIPVDIPQYHTHNA